jgi:DNA (cytosine-5)-methyltransferase 1
VTTLAYLIGAGSLSIGVERAGFKLCKVFETEAYNTNAKGGWNANRPDLIPEVLELDHTSHKFCLYRDWGLDLIHGNPMCGGVSSMTRSRISSPTNSGMRKWVRMVVKAEPRSILMENGFQLGMPRMWSLLSDLTSILQNHGYEWWIWKHYAFQVGTPQVRRRMWLCATKEKIKRPELIDTSELDHLTKEDAPTLPWIEDLIGIPPSKTQGVVTNRYGQTVTGHHYGTWTDYVINTLNASIPEGRWYLQNGFVGPKHVQKQIKKGQEPDQSPIWENCPGEWNGCMSMFKPSVIRLFSCAPALIGKYKYVHPIDDRVLTHREMCRLMGFPDDWEFSDYNPNFIAQGVPVNNSRWAADRLKWVIGMEDR